MAKVISNILRIGMSNMIALSVKETEGKAWKVPSSLLSFKNFGVVPVNIHEAGRIGSTMPLAVKDGELMALCGTSEDSNLFIDTKGAWIGVASPEWFETYPFFLYSVGKQAIPCFDTDSGWLLEGSDAVVEGESFFTDEKVLSEQVKLRVDKLSQSHGKLLQTQLAVKALVAAKVLMPWPEKIINHYDIKISSLLTLDEKAFNDLSDEQFLLLKKSGAIALGYMLAFSLNQAHILERLNRLNGVSKPAVEFDVERFFGEDDDSLKFNI